MLFGINKLVTHDDNPSHVNQNVFSSEPRCDNYSPIAIVNPLMFVGVFVSYVPDLSNERLPDAKF